MLDDKTKLIIFGVGNQKKNIATYIAEKFDGVVDVVDNDIEKQGTLWNNLFYIRPVADIVNYLNDNVKIIITTYRFHQEMKKQLLEYGWDENRIIIAIQDISFFKSFEFQMYLKEIDIDNLIPSLVNIELSGFCNCKCIYCPFHGEVGLKEGHKGLMSEKTMTAIIEQVKKIPTIKTVDTTGPGEIFINKMWYELLQNLLINTNIDQVIMYTNGMLLNDDNIRKITLLEAKKIQVEISIDGTSPEENDTYRIGSQYHIIRKQILKAKKVFDTIESKEISLVITNCYPTTLEEIEKNNYELDSKQNEIPFFLIKDFPSIQIASQKTFLYGSSTELIGFRGIKVRWPKNENRCINLFYRLAINYEGELLRCSCGHAGIIGIGNVFEDDILKLWKTEKELVRARTNFIEKRVDNDFCEGCPGKGLGEYELLIKNR